MKLDNVRVLTFKSHYIEEIVAMKNGGEGIKNAPYLVNLGKQPNED
ncbi:MAG: hypothetical protein ACTXOO_04680 [Sodalis sp. (in: enterobacteria)]